MSREPGLFNAYTFLRRGDSPQAGLPDGRWVPARPLGGMLGRFRAAWLVFTGRCDVLWWPKQGDQDWKP